MFMALVKKLIENESSFYKNGELPKIRVGDTVKVTIFLELSKDESSEKGGKKKKGLTAKQKKLPKALQRAILKRQRGG